MIEGSDRRVGLVSEVVETGPRTGNTLSMVEEALREAHLEREQIECVAVGLGPGSYNGVRVAIALAQGWQLAGGVKVRGISSVECLAAQAQAEGVLGRLNVVIDAQRNEFYLASYEVNAQSCREIEPLRLATFAEVQKRERSGELLMGPEATKWFPGSRVIFPRAAALGRLAAKRQDSTPGEELKPIYLRETSFVKAAPSRKLFR